MDINQYTNVPQLYAELGLEKHNCALWHCHSADATADLLNVDMSTFLPTTGSWATADKIFVIGQECTQFHLVNVDLRIHVWESAGLVDHPRVHFNPFWIYWPVWANASVNSTDRLSDPTQHTPKYMFDCLIGHARANKTFVGNFVTKNNLTDRILFSFFHRDKKWIQGHDYDDIKSTNNTQFNIDYGGKLTTMLSLFIPYLIYNDSWFSIVPETSPRTNLISEKTAKPLMSRRLFIMFSGAKHLEALHNLGFQTFGNIIDESYDQEQDHVKRWTMAAEQIKYLLTQDPADVYEKALPALTHNQKLIFDIDWLNMLHQSIINVACEAAEHQ